MIALTPTQAEVQRTFTDFVTKRVLPQAEQIDREQAFPMDLFRQIGDLGFFGMRYPEKDGGTGFDTLSYTLAVIELARGSLSLAAAATMQSLMATYFLHRFGHRTLKEAYFQPALNGEKIGGICMTEPNAGTDLFGITTKATQTDEGFELNGQKTWVTSAPVADFLTVLARTEEEKGLSIFFVPTHLDGVVIGKSIEKLGVRGSLTSEVQFDAVRIPANHLLGEKGAGTSGLREILVDIRMMTAALSVGLASAVLDTTIDYARTRTQFGRPIGTFQAIRLMIADMTVQLDMARSYLLQLAQCDRPTAQRAAIAKLYASECANQLCDLGSRVMASYGYAMEYPMQRYLRDARFLLIGGGTSEILKINIAKGVGL